MKWIYDNLTEDKNDTFYVDNFYYKNESENIKERLRICKKDKNDYWCRVYYCKISKSDRLGFDGKYEYDIIKSYHKYMALSEAMIIVSGNRLEKLKRIIDGN